MDRPDFSVSVLTDSSAFRALQSDWETLFAQSSKHHFFHDFSWNFHSWTCIGAESGEELRIIVGRERGKAVLILPLMVKNRTARLLTPEAFAYRDLLLAEDHDDLWFHATWNALLGLKEIDSIHLQNVLSPSNLEKLIMAVKPNAWYVDDDSPVIKLRNYGNWEAYASSRRKKLIADQRRQWRKINQLFPNIECVAVQESADVNQLIRWMLAQKQSWVERKGLSGMSWRNGRESVLQGVAMDALERGRLLVLKLAAGEDVLAAGMGFVHNNQFTFELFSYDPKFENFSPSRLLLERLVRWCLDHRVEIFDFLPESPQGSPYKYDWADDRFKSRSYIIPITTRGTVLSRWRRSDISAVAKSRVTNWVYHQLPKPTRSTLRNLAYKSSRGEEWARLRFER